MGDVFFNLFCFEFATQRRYYDRRLRRRQSLRQKCDCRREYPESERRESETSADLRARETTLERRASEMTADLRARLLLEVDSNWEEVACRHS